MKQILVAAVACASALASCSSSETPSSSGSYYLRPSSTPSFSGAKNDGADELKWAPRGGLVMFLGSDIDVDPRMTIGAFTSFAETDARRVEAGIDITPDFAADLPNYYVTVSGDYVHFIGEGALSARVGGGGIWETRDDDLFFIPVVEFGVGVWVAVGDDESDSAFIANAMFQLPLSDANPGTIFSITAGYEF